MPKNGSDPQGLVAARGADYLSRISGLSREVFFLSLCNGSKQLAMRFFAALFCLANEQLEWQ
jgi:hypothetical protein